METDLQDFAIDLLQLKEGRTEHDYHIGSAFFAHYENELVSDGQLEAHLTLDKTAAMIVANFSLKGHVELVCDRSLEPFDEPMEWQKRVIFKYGEEEGEIDEEVFILPYGAESLDSGRFFYEFVLLEVPQKRLRPDLRDEEDESGSYGKMIYEDEPTAEDNGEANDPRFEALKKLRFDQEAKKSKKDKE